MKHHATAEVLISYPQSPLYLTSPLWWVLFRILP